MRQMFAVVVLTVVAGCGEPLTRTDRGDGTTIVSSGSQKELFCTNPDCSGIMDLTISGTDLYSVNLARLTSVGSLVIAGNLSLARVSLPALTSASPLEISRNPALLTLDVPALTSVSTPLTITDNMAFPQCQAAAIFARLVAFTGEVIITGNNSAGGCAPIAGCGGDVTITSGAELDAFVARGCTSLFGSLGITGTELTTVSLPALTTVSASLGIARNTQLTRIELPALTAVADVQLWHNTQLTSIGLPVLTTLRGLSVADNASLRSFSFPVLTMVTERLFVYGNDALTNFDLSALTSLGFGLAGLPPRQIVPNPPLTIANNRNLPECLAMAFENHLVAVNGLLGPWASIWGNDTIATCPP